MGLTPYCLLLAIEGTSVLHECPSETSSAQTSMLCNTVVFPLLHLRPVCFWNNTLFQACRSSIFVQSYWWCLAVSCILHYSSYLKLYEVLTTSNARADILETVYKLDEVVKIFHSVSVKSHMKESFL